MPRSSARMNCLRRSLLSLLWTEVSRLRFSNCPLGSNLVVKAETTGLHRFRLIAILKICPPVESLRPSCSDAFPSSVYSAANPDTKFGYEDEIEGWFVRFTVPPHHATSLTVASATSRAMRTRTSRSFTSPPRR